MEEIAGLTYESGGNEHAVISLTDGRRIIVEGGTGGIEFASGLRRVIVHVHPIATGPSHADMVMLEVTGQRSSWLYEAGGLLRFRRH